MIKIISLFCAFLALSNTVDVHAMSHLFSGDNHNQIENCLDCEEFVVSTQENVSVLPQTSFYLISTTNFTEKPLLNSTEVIFINQEKHLGIFHNKPPPFLIYS